MIAIRRLHVATLTGSSVSPQIVQLVASAHSEHRFPAPSSKGRKDVVNQCLEFASTSSVVRVSGFK